MNRAKYYLNGQPTKSKPINFEQLSVTVDWGSDKDVEVDLDKVVFMGEDAEDILTHRTNFGTTTLMPFDIEVGSLSLPPMGLDFRKAFELTGCNEVEVGVKILQGKTSFIDNASAIQFLRLEEEGKFLSSDYVKIPYNRNYIPDELQLLMLSVSVYMIARELTYSIKEAAHTLAEASTVVNVPLSILNAVIRLAYFVAMVITIKNLMQQIFDQLYQPTRWHTGIKLRSLFRVGLAEMGLTFNSTIFDAPKWRDAVYLPAKTKVGALSSSITQSGAPTRSEDCYFLGDFILRMMEQFNADYRISNGEFRFERWDWWALNSSIVLDDNWTDQTELINRIGDNSADFVGGYTITYPFDPNDQNTYDNFAGTVYDVITNNVTLPNADKAYDNSGGVRFIELPYCRATRKGSLTTFENVLIGLFTTVDTVTNIFSAGNGTNFATQVAARVNNMVISEKLINRPKIVRMNTALTGLDATQPTAKELWDDYHYINSFKQINGKHNQWEIFKLPFKICVEKFITLLNNNFVTTTSGEIAEIERLQWTIEEDAAEAIVRVNRLTNNNLKQAFLDGTDTTNGFIPFA
jgi:hypothetical protein